MSIDHETEKRHESSHGRRITWNGTTDEATSLLYALREYCRCIVEQGRTIEPCPGHHMLANDQRAVDGLLFGRRKAPKLLAEEFDLPNKLEIAISE